MTNTVISVLFTKPVGSLPEINPSITFVIAVHPTRGEKIMGQSLTKKQIEDMKNTCRTKGAVGKNAVVPKWILENVDKGCKILDFGAGKEAIHAQMLKEAGFGFVFAYDYNFNPDKHISYDSVADTSWDVIFLSNVLNVQPSISELMYVVSRMCEYLRTGGQFICNFPKEPRKNNATFQTVKNILEDYFSRVETDTKKHMFICTK